jgi:hypothetical protein
LGKNNDAVTIGVSVGIVECANIFAIQVHGHVVVESEDRQSLLGLRFVDSFERSHVPRCDAFFQTLAHIVLSDNGCVLLEDGISTGVVLVVMSIDDEPDWLVGDALQSCFYFVGQRRVLVVDYYNAILANRRADIAPFPFEHVNRSSYMGHLHLHLAEILILCGQQS